MNLFARAMMIATVFLAASCSPGDPGPGGNAADSPVKTAPILSTPDARDIHSYARPAEARVTHVALDLAVDFASKRVGGTAALDVERRPDAKEIILDSKGLEIRSVKDGAGQPLDHKLGAADATLGAPLAIALKPDTDRIVVDYISAPDAGALQWLNPQQTAGKKHPYLLSQGQAIENRSWIPTQDSPGIRQSWEAKIRVPKPLTAVMSAPRAADPVDNGDTRTFAFKMANPVAPYLIAIGVGDLAFRSLGARSGVWTEPSMLDAAATELADTEKMIDAAEGLFGPYLWGRYDMLVLPPSFPFGGMENPTLTFLTPTFIAGDKSLVSLIAHELAHSWSGNLATNATWADFWLNEGMTTYATYRIVEALYGPKVAQQQYALGLDSLNKEMAGLPAADTKLRLDLAGRSPDEGLTEVAYEKGAALMRAIEAAVGRERFDGWLKGWFERHKFAPVTSAMFLADLREHLIKGDAELERKLMLDAWVERPGLPANLVAPDPAAFAEVDQAVAQFNGPQGAIPAAAWSRWTTHERLRFLNKLPRKLERARLDSLERQFRLSETRNSEVLFAWLELAVANRFDPAIPALERFLTVQGRRKFVRPLIEALAKDAEWGRPIATRVYRVARPLYHPITTRDLDALGLT